jgi:hypothetical protein
MDDITPVETTFVCRPQFFESVGLGDKLVAQQPAGFHEFPPFVDGRKPELYRWGDDQLTLTVEVTNAAVAVSARPRKLAVTSAWKAIAPSGYLWSPTAA